MVDQHRLGAHHVADGDDRQVEPVGLAGRRIDRGRAGRAEAAADDIRADDEEAVGVDDLARPDQHFPPARLAGHRIGAGDMLVAGQRVADQDRRWSAPALSCAIGLVGDLERRQQRAGVERQRLVGAEAHAPGSTGRRPRPAALACLRRDHRSLTIAGRLLRGNKKTGIAHRKAGYCPSNGPLASCLTWLQADRPNHHGTSPAFTIGCPLRQRKSFDRAGGHFR